MEKNAEPKQRGRLKTRDLFGSYRKTKTCLFMLTVFVVFIPRAVDAMKLTPPPKSNELNSLIPDLELHGGIAVYWYQPTNGYDPLYFIYSNLKITTTWDWFGIYFEPRASSEKMRAYYDGLAWIQQAYLFAELAPKVSIKLGRVYKQSGIAWDNSFYGNIQMYDGLKFDPNNGLSFEGQWGKTWGTAVNAQYFIMDGGLNSSLPNRDTISIPDARRRNILAARVQPFYQPLENLRLEGGVSGETFAADLPSGKNSVKRFAVDLKLTAYQLSLWGEVLHQVGASVEAFPVAADMTVDPPVPGQSSASNTYLLGGVQYAFGPVVPRYNISIVDYRDVEVREVLHLPGITYNFHEHGSIYVEYAFWDRHSPQGRLAYDRSLNLTVMGYF